MLAMELIPAIRRVLEGLEANGDPVITGRRAALWRAQQRAAALDLTVEDLRRYCIESLRPRRFLDENDYLRGYREGFQAVLREIRRLETGDRPS
jgi:hypothetical protein